MDYSINSIENGIVIDHLPSDKTLKIFQLLYSQQSENTVSIGFNLNSQSKSSKGIIKIENHDITNEQIAHITFIAPDSTVNIIKNYKVIDKKRVVRPDQIENILICPNSKCISRIEPHVETLFYIHHNDKLPLRIVCHYCEKTFTQDEMLYLLK